MTAPRGPWSAEIDEGSASLGTVVIDSATVILLDTNPYGIPNLAAGNYDVKLAITDGAGNWSNLVEYSFVSDGAHGYSVSWNPPLTLWSIGSGTVYDAFGTNPFEKYTNVFAWLSFNGGAFRHLVQALINGSVFTTQYSWWNPTVYLSNGYTTDAVPIPVNLNTLPAVKLSPGLAAHITGAILDSPQMGMINIMPIGVGLNLAGALVINGPAGKNTLFIDPEGHTGLGTGGIYFEKSGVGFGSLYFTGDGVLNVGDGIAAANGALALAKIRATSLAAHANNAAAISAGLSAGDFYRTGADPDLVCVVH